MYPIIITVCNTYSYDSVKVGKGVVSVINPKKCRQLLNYKTAVLNGILLHFFVNELRNCSGYRSSFLRLFKKFNCDKLNVKLVPVTLEIIDYKWNLRISQLVFVYSELDHSLSWLSTLGGAFSALGDYFATHAEVAGKISFHQLKIALKLNDPSIIARCYLYYSLSLIQKCKFKQAKAIILFEYNKTKAAPVCDTRISNMCKGIWSKLKYEKSIYKGIKRINEIKV